MTPPILSPLVTTGEFVVMLSDWYDTEGNAQAMELNRWDLKSPKKTEKKT